MLVWSRKGYYAVMLLAALLIGVFYVLPLTVIGAASFAGEWNDTLPIKLTLQHYLNVAHSDMRSQVWVSLATGALASAAALMVGTWSALALRAFSEKTQRLLNMLFFVPSAVPSVSVGLGLLVAFSRPPLLLNGTTSIVLMAHFIMVFAFTYGNISTGLKGIPPGIEQMAQSLGAKPGYCLRHVTLPLIVPQMATAFSLSFALSMGELGATVMVYPPGWMTMPVGIFSLSDRGEIFDGSALSIILIVVTLLALSLVALVSERNKGRKR